jgi:hypothetical protein
MAGNDVSYHERAMIEFCVKENISVVDVFDQLSHVCGDPCMGDSSMTAGTSAICLSTVN